MLCLLFVAWPRLSGDVYGQTDDEHLGLTEYEIACIPCHGIDGRGHGEAANSLKTVPSDLTVLSRSNNGEFPRSRIIKQIDVRAMVAAHGQREMPVWGNRYRRNAFPGESRNDFDQRARLQIEALAGYIKSIQVR